MSSWEVRLGGAAAAAAEHTKEAPLGLQARDRILQHTMGSPRVRMSSRVTLVGPRMPQSNRPLFHLGWAECAWGWACLELGPA